jgi:ElaB/YqjD/DUF883 family membrane-anchored ribosome-binding protein
MPNSPTDGFTDPTQGARSSTGDQAAQSVDKIKADAANLKTEAENLAGSVATEATEQAGHIADEAKAQAAAAVQKAKGFASEQKDLLAGQIGGVAEAMQRVAEDLEANSGSSAQYARVIADNAEKLSSTIKYNDVDALLNMAQDFGRRQPTAFVGVAALLGFAASRFLLASSSRATTRPAPQSGDETVASDYAPSASSTSRSAYSGGRL